MMKKAFTLIELLVVIAIIAILAAILFPVFAQAKKAAKTSVALSNLKQIGLAENIYCNDNDDSYPGRRYATSDGAGGYFIWSWKDALMPYTKSYQMFTDPINPAAQYPDDTSDPVAAKILDNNFTLSKEPTFPKPTGSPVFARGYSLVNNFWLTGDWGGPGVPASDIPQPSSIMQMEETESVFVDYGPYINFCDGGPNDVANGCPGQESQENGGGLIPITWPNGTQSNFGGFKTKGPKGHGSVIEFYDSHVQLQSPGQYCNNANPSALNEWGFVPATLATNNFGGSMGVANIPWLDGFCTEVAQDGE